MDDPLATTNLILAIVTLLAALLALPPLVVRLFKTLGHEKTAAQLEVLRQIATASVAAVEQMNKKTGVSSEEKLAAALDLATTQLKAYGMTVSPEQLRAAIEAAVMLTKVGLQLPPPPADPNVIVDPGAAPTV